MAKKSDSGMSQDTKTIIVILLLLIVYPVGLIMMFVWMKWPWWVKLLVALPIAAFLLIIPTIMMAAFSVSNPSTQVAKAHDVAMRNTATSVLLGITKYKATNNTYPWGKVAVYKSDDIRQEAWLLNLIKNDYVNEISATDKMRLDKSGEEIEICYQSQALKTEVCVP